MANNLVRMMKNHSALCLDYQMVRLKSNHYVHPIVKHLVIQLEATLGDALELSLGVTEDKPLRKSDGDTLGTSDRGSLGKNPWIITC